ncbi:pirin family protein [Glaciimonas soli]|uniref:Quercetin 2,3-dioxygenase n=1 Tax=Glaciimonas soli TaxID=2590999 RepID=A0A843YSE8_9BURK|nr:pirin family protein [Glaciimonas soli]MQR00172.1 quercetin 2,3-dioxygenase [Glaciimonas soli]
MITVRKSSDRGHANHGWLDSHFSFSFAEYYDPEHMGFGPLRVINEDRIQAGTGFGTHGHKDMEIITYILEGALAHKDSMGTGSVIRPGDVQRMSAGSGVRHSEFNDAPTETHLLQIWIMPNVAGIAPSYEEKNFSRADKDGKLRLIASSDGRDGSVMMHQDASLYAGLFDGAQSATHPLTAQRLAYIHVARGKVTVNGEKLNAGDAVKISAETEVRINDGEQAEVLLFDLPV